MLRARILPAIGVLALVASLGGCASPYLGVAHDFTIERLPDMECVRREIAQTEGASLAEYRRTRAEKGLFGSRVPPGYSFVYWENTSIPAQAELEFILENEGRVHVRNIVWTKETEWAQSVTDTVRPIMLNLESGLSKACGMPSVPATFGETCNGVRCMAGP